MLEQVCWQDVWPHGRDPTLEQKSVRRKVQQRQRDELTATPAPCPLRCAGGEEVEKSGVKMSPEKREGWGEGVFQICSYFSLSYSDFD